RIKSTRIWHVAPQLVAWSHDGYFSENGHFPAFPREGWEVMSGSYRDWPWLGFVLMDLPAKQGLYDPQNEHDACGVGFVANIKGAKSHDIVAQGLQLLINLDHRGAVGADPSLGDGAGCLIQIPDLLLRDWAGKAG